MQLCCGVHKNRIIYLICFTTYWQITCTFALLMAINNKHIPYLIRVHFQNCFLFCCLQMKDVLCETATKQKNKIKYH